MKEFIETLIGRLEKESKKWLDIFEKEHRKGNYDSYSDGMNDAFEEAIQIVNQLAEEYNQDSTKNNQGWIPVTERLPEIEADVLVSLRSLDVYTGFRANTEGCFYVDGEGYVEIENVLAWQPLPSPYKPEEYLASATQELSNKESQPNFYAERFNRVL